MPSAATSSGGPSPADDLADLGRPVFRPLPQSRESLALAPALSCRGFHNRRRRSRRFRSARARSEAPGAHRTTAAALWLRSARRHRNLAQLAEIADQSIGNIHRCGRVGPHRLRQRHSRPAVRDSGRSGISRRRRSRVQAVLRAGSRSNFSPSAASPIVPVTKTRSPGFGARRVAPCCRAAMCRRRRSRSKPDPGVRTVSPP